MTDTHKNHHYVRHLSGKKYKSYPSVDRKMYGPLIQTQRTGISPWWSICSRIRCCNESTFHHAIVSLKRGKYFLSFSLYLHESKWRSLRYQFSMLPVVRGLAFSVAGGDVDLADALPVWEELVEVIGSTTKSGSYIYK